MPAASAQRVIDCDSHVEESAVVWKYLDKKYKDREPIPMKFPYRPGLPAQNSFWLIDGEAHPKPNMGHGSTIVGTPPDSQLALQKPYSVGSQDLTDVAARLKDMDAAGVDVQVQFPSVFIEPLTGDVQFEAALMRSYNTWIAETCAQKPDRLKWVAVVPMNDPAAAVREMKAARKQGCIGISVHGTVGNLMLHDPRFDPVWAAALDLDLPVGIHVGWSHPGLTWSCDDMYSACALSLMFPVVMGFWSFTGGGILDRFPNLRVGFLEAGLEWLPMVLARMDHYYKFGRAVNEPLKTVKPAHDWLKEAQIYLSTEGDDHLLTHVIETIGADRLMMSADMPHGDVPVDLMPAFTRRNDVAPDAQRMILGESAARFYKI
jgi:predicted TIM-barrel fold metal-dependent hydrolase